MAEPPTWLSAWRTAALAAVVQLARLALAVTADQLLGDYDTSTSLHGQLCTPESGNQPNDAQAGAVPVTAQLLVWDSVFFARIACRGYEHQQQYAFFPLLPALMRPWRGSLGAMATAGLAVSFVAATVSPVLLSRLTVAVTGDLQLARYAALLYIFSPASVFHTAVYTEGVFGLATLAGLCALYCPDGTRGFGAGVHAPDAPSSLGKAVHDSHTKAARGMPDDGGGAHAWAWQGRLWLGAVCFTLASTARSNGVINAGFLLHASAQAVIHTAAPVLLRPVRTRMCAWPGALLRAAAPLGTGVMSSALVTMPLVLHQLHAHALQCAGTPGAAPNPVLGPGWLAAHLRSVMALLWEPPLQAQGDASAPIAVGGAWCTRHPAWWPAVYGHVQDKYWNVGVLRYWRLSQVPNFVLAAPVLCVAGAACAAYVGCQWRVVVTGGFDWAPRRQRALRAPGADHTAQRVPTDAPTPGLTTRSQALRQRAARSYAGRLDHSSEQAATAQPSSQASQLSPEVAGFFHLDVCVFMYPLAFMTACAALVMHVQVATRFLSVSPALYWYLAHLLIRAQVTTGGQHGTRRQARAGAGDSNHTYGRGLRVAHAIWGWCWGYTLLGTVLFVNFYPWT